MITMSTELRSNLVLNAMCVPLPLLVDNLSFADTVILCLHQVSEDGWYLYADVL